MENKRYITKIEQKLLQFAKKKPTGNELKDISFSHLNNAEAPMQQSLKDSRMQSSFSFENKAKPDTASKKMKSLEETVANLNYEIKILTIALVF